jgi:hypothetical protein
MSTGSAYGIWLRNLANEVKMLKYNSLLVMNDNTSAIENLRNNTSDSKLKHINIRYHWLKDNVASKDIKVFHVNSTNNLADIFTKPLSRDQHHYLCKLLGLVSIRSQS